jgi:hypothetical protein
MGPMAFAEHFTVGGGGSQRGGWHLADPKVGRQYGAGLGDSGLRPEGRSSSSVLDDQSGGRDRDQQRSAGKYSPLSVTEGAGSNDQGQQDDQAGHSRP